jgi:LmbE family N-acetylglucosaminyl deacetylase
MKRLLLFCLLVPAAFSGPAAQMRVAPLDEAQGHVALGLALRRLSNTGIFMHTTAHPDDENNGLLVMLNHGQGYRTALATATRGNGGQNEIGPEIFEALGVLRTQELAAVHRFDGAEQYFTRAVDFGYSFSIDETFEKWGRDEITADYVRLIRTIRPDVIITLAPTGDAGGQHHMASAVITRDAYRLAGDPAKYPEQIKEGLRPWQAKKLYHSAGFGSATEAQSRGRITRINTGVYDRLLGRTYAEIGTEARSMHKCQGMGQLLSLPAPMALSSYELVETSLPVQVQKDESSLFDGVDTSLAGLAQFTGSQAPAALNEGLKAIANAAVGAQKHYDTISDEATVGPLLDGLAAVRALRVALRTMSIDEAARYEIDVRLRQKEREFQHAAIVAAGLKIEALADDGVVVPGQQTKVSVIVANRGTADITVRQVKLDGFDGNAGCQLTAVTGGGVGRFGGGRGGRGSPLPSAGPPISVIRKDQVARCAPAVTIPANASITEPYWHREGEAGRYTFDKDGPFGLPVRPTPFYAEVTVAVAAARGTEDLVERLPIQHRYEGSLFSGEKRTELLVVPAYSVRVSPDVAIVPSAAIRSLRTNGPARRAAGTPVGGGETPPVRRAAPARIPDRWGTPSDEREIRVTVVNGSPGAAAAAVHLEVPQGWSATPPEQSATFGRKDESQTLRFVVKPAPDAQTGEFRVRAVATAGSRSYTRGYQVIEYPHIRRYHIYDPAGAALKVIDVRIPPNLTVGYVMGVGDQVPSAIEQLGARVEMIGAEDLAWGDLSRFDTIVTGVRAYERRDDLRANNSRLLEYVKNGGTVIVQYNKFEFNDAQYGPYPARVSSNRVTDEFAPVVVLDRRNPVFTTPNEINEAAWQNWVQERGLYFLGDKDSRYRDLVQLQDPFPKNPGVKTGALVKAQYGKGQWIYLGLGLWRQLPAGTDGAYQLLANLISLGIGSR